MDREESQQGILFCIYGATAPAPVWRLQQDRLLTRHLRLGDEREEIVEYRTLVVIPLQLPNTSTLSQSFTQNLTVTHTSDDLGQTSVIHR